MNTRPQNRCGSLWARTRRQDNETRALDARKASCAAPISMGRGEIPVEPQPAAIRLNYFILMSILLSIAVLKGRCIMTCEKKVQVKDKFCLTIDEAAEYFNIGEKKLRKIVADHLDSGFVIQNGVKVLIKRKRFEDFLGDLTAL